MPTLNKKKALNRTDSKIQEGCLGKMRTTDEISQALREINTRGINQGEVRISTIKKTLEWVLNLRETLNLSQANGDAAK